MRHIRPIQSMNTARVILTLIFFLLTLFILTVDVALSIKSSAWLALLLHYISGRIIFYNYSHVIHLFTPTRMFYLTFEIYIGVGSIAILIFPELLLHKIASYTDLSYDLNKYMWTMALGIFIVALVDHLHLKGKSIECRYKDYQKNKDIIIKNIRARWVLISTGFGICLFVGVLRFLLQSSIYEMFSMLVKGEIMGGEFRKELTGSQYTGGIYFGQGYMTFIIYNIMPFFGLLAYLKYDLQKRYIMKCFVMLMVLALIFGEFRRDPIIRMLMCFMVLSLFMGNKHGNLKLFITGIVLFGVLYIITLYLGGRGHNILSSILYRLFISQTQTGTYVFQIFPRYEEYSLGLIYLHNLSGVMPGADISYSTQLFDIIHERFGGASHSSIAEAYANFGVFGVIIISGMYGFLFSRMKVRLDNNTNPMHLAYYITLTIFLVPGLAVGSIITPMLGIMSLNICLLILKLGDGIAKG
jgi:oligosaccharide repeat unit polymerase